MNTKSKHDHRFTQIRAEGRVEYEKASKLEYIISIIAYFIVGLPLIDIQFIGYLLFSFVFNLVSGVITGPIYAMLATKRYNFNDDEAFNKWYGKTYYFPVMALHLILGVLTAIIFNNIWG